MLRNKTHAMQQGTFVVKNAGSAAIKIHILAVATDEEVGSPICEKKSKYLITEHSSENLPLMIGEGRVTFYSLLHAVN